VREGVVQDDRDVEVLGDFAIERGQELLELDRAMAAVRPPDHFAGGQIQRRVEA
jgi:hypothetical protein